MPKRETTPPPGDDEPRYLTVCHPYPLHANMELPEDRKVFTFWLACIIGKKDLYAFFHKPSARDMIIIEVARDFPHFDRLLGAHNWSSFLNEPTDEQKDQVSKIFYCQLSTGRQVQKSGWKRINVEDSWFTSWSPNNKFIKYPYPDSEYCDLPIEDQTTQPLCRTLPRQTFVPPPKIRPPPVGSAGWIDTKLSPLPPATPISAKTKTSSWSKGPPISTTFTKASSSSSNSPGPYSARSPTTFSPTTFEIPNPALADIPRRTSSTGSASGSTSSRSAPSTSTQDQDTGPETPVDVDPWSSPDSLNDWPSASAVIVVEATSALDALTISDSASLAPVPSLWGTDEGFADESANGDAEGDHADLWAEIEAQENQKASSAAMCSVHGIICKKGICAEYARQLKKAQEEERRKNGGLGAGVEGKGARGGKGGRGGKGFKGRANTNDRSSGGASASNWRKNDDNAKANSGAKDKTAASTGNAWNNSGTRVSTKPQAESARSAPVNAWASDKGSAPVNAWASNNGSVANEHADDNGFTPVARGRPQARARGGGWGKVSNGPWGGSSKAGSVFGGESVNGGASVNGDGDVNGGWGDEEVEKASVVSSKGWGAVSNGPY